MVIMGYVMVIVGYVVVMIAYVVVIYRPLWLYISVLVADIYWEVMELRKQMACAKCGLSPFQ